MKTEHMAEVLQDSQIEAAVYREHLQECKRLADLSIDRSRFPLGQQISMWASIALNDDERKMWGKEWKVKWDQDIGRLTDALHTLKQIELLVMDLSHDEDSNRAIKARLLEITKRATATQPGYSVNL